MWYRDQTLVAQRREELVRQAREASLIAELRAASRATTGNHGRVRTTSAAGIRGMARVALALAERIDTQCREGDATRTRIAYR